MRVARVVYAVYLTLVATGLVVCFLIAWAAR